ALPALPEADSTGRGRADPFHARCVSRAGRAAESRTRLHSRGELLAVRQLRRRQPARGISGTAAYARSFRYRTATKGLETRDGSGGRRGLGGNFSGLQRGICSRPKHQRGLLSVSCGTRRSTKLGSVIVIKTAPTAPPSPDKSARWP